MKKILISIFAFAGLLAIGLGCYTPISAYASEKVITNNCRAYILLDKDSGQVLNAYNEQEQMPVASIIKLMTILLTLEALDNGEISLDDKVCVSANASSMGGSQVFLDANTEYVLGELLKSVIIASANDSSVALAEHLAGSEQLFVQKMNVRAKELGLSNTNYENATGLPTTNQYSCAKDVALVLRKVLDYPTYQEFSKIWLQDFVHPSGRTTEMTNTNKLSRFYDGCLGGKTGSTNEAKYCLAVGAEKNNMRLIAVVLGSENSKERFSNTSELLNYGFANFENKVLFNGSELNDIKIKMQGQNEYLSLKAERQSNKIVTKNTDLKLDLKYNLPNSLTSVKENEIVGFVDIIINGEKYDTINLLADRDIEEPSFLDYLKRIQQDFVA